MQLMRYSQQVLRVPHSFLPAGHVKDVEFCETPAFVAKARKNQRASGAAKAGLIYEKNIDNNLSDQFQEKYIPGPWIKFNTVEDPFKSRVCQPDGLFIDISTGTVTIVEVKLKHKIRAWWQLRHLYQPVVQKLFGPDWEFKVCEICKFYETRVKIPEPVHLLQFGGIETSVKEKYNLFVDRLSK